MTRLAAILCLLAGIAAGLAVAPALGWLWPVRVEWDEPGGGWDEAVLTFASKPFPFRFAAEPRG